MDAPSTLTDQLIERPELALRHDAVAVTYLSATVDGTERHAVRRVTWTNGNTSGTRTECGRNARPGSFSATAAVTCKHCLRHPLWVGQATSAEATCASCGDTFNAPAGEDAADTLCVACADADAS